MDRERRSRSRDSHRSRRRYSRSRSHSRDRGNRDINSRRRSRERMSHYRGSGEKDLYRDIIGEDYHEDNRNRAGADDDFGEDRERFWNDRSRDKGGRDYEREQRDHRDYERDRDRGRERDRKDNRYGRNNRRYDSDRDHDSGGDSDDSYSNNNGSNYIISNTIIATGLHPNITEADITSSLIQVGMAAASIRLIRKRITGASRGFAFVEFNTIDEATRWMELTQGTLQLPDQTRATLHYSNSREQTGGKSRLTPTDWYCGRCGVLNFRRRDVCFKCCASREGCEGGDEVSNILTKKIMLRNLDVLTNEEGVLTALQQHVPDLAKKINKILVSRDSLTQTSRGICYLNFENLIDSMNLHNALATLDPPFEIDNREVVVSYCIDHENRQIIPKKPSGGDAASSSSVTIGPMTAAEMVASSSGSSTNATAQQYTLNDVPRLAEYSAALYASTPAEHAHYLKYYTDYYISEINQGQFANLPSSAQVNETSANSGAAVALSAIQRKQKKMNNIETTATAAATQAAQAAAMVKAAQIAAQSVVTPKGNDGKTYPTPDVSLYQYDETSGYYYDPSTGLYYDAHSQYYYNNETGAYLYWDQRKSTYVLATPAAAAATVQDVVKQDAADETKAASVDRVEDSEAKKDKKDSGNKHDKVKVAKKIVKDMEKWAKQLNQKKDYTVVATPQPILPAKSDEPSTSRAPQIQFSAGVGAGYADVGFSILEKKERAKLTDFITPTAATASSKLVSAYGSDSDEDHHAAAPPLAKNSAEASEKDYVDFQKLTCLLCKRAFQSLDILQKHLKMSNLHKENLQKFSHEIPDAEAAANALSYRDRAKERRLKYGESDPPPPNRSRERFEKEIKSLTSRRSDTNAVPQMPISSSNVGNRLLQKMGWSEGQGLGRKNQGRTNIVEANGRSSTAGLGTKSGMAPGDDYKTYIKKMMKSRYESV